MDEGSPLARYTLPLRRWWYVVVVAVVVGVVAAVVTLPGGPGEIDRDDPDTSYRASYLLIRNSASPEPINFDLVELLARQGDLTSRVLDRTEADFRTRDIDDVELDTDPEVGSIAITTTQPTAARATELVDVYAQELQAVVDERAAAAIEETAERSEARLPVLSERIDELEQQVDAAAEDSVDRQLLQAELDLLVADFAAEQAQARASRERLGDLEPQFETLQEPTPVPTDALGDTLGIPTSPVPRVAIFALLGLIAGVLAAVTIDRLDVRIRTRADAETAFGLPVIAELPPRSAKHRADQPIPVRSDPDGATAEAFRSLRLALLLAPTWRLSGDRPTTNDGSVGSVAPTAGSHGPTTLLVTSPLTGDGKSTTVANLAASFAESGQTVLVVDCDFRRPAVGELLGVGPGEGLRDLPDLAPASVWALAADTQVPGVTMIRSGAPGIAPSWFLANARQLVEALDGVVDVVVFDTGPITLTNEASALIPAVDAALVVNRAGRLSRAQAHGTIEQLARIGASVAGVVLVGTDSSKRYGYYSPYATSSTPPALAPDEAGTR